MVYKRQLMLLVCVVFVAATFFASYQKITAVMPTMAQVNTFPTIVVDAGHGGEDGGAVGTENQLEKDINLAISLKLETMLKAYGFNVVMTRETDTSIHDDGVTGTRNQKVSDIKNRLKLVEENPGCIFLSIHQNKFTVAKYDGAQVFFGPQNANSELLAQTIQKNFIGLLQPENTRQIKKGGDDYYILSHTTVPAVLIECGFLSNPQEAALLSDDEYQSKVAFTILCSVMEYINNTWS